MEIIKQYKDTMSISNKNSGKKRVVAYARVSTDLEKQENSFNSQKNHYYNLITNNDEWEFAGIYADDGITGTSDNNRQSFRNMIRDAYNGLFDLIITKSISRFARNTVDTLKYVRLLKEKNIGIYFEEENINTLNSQGELLITILGSLSQQESENISSHCKAGRLMAINNGTVKISSKCYGYIYNKETSTYTINEEEAKVVKIIFSEFIKSKNYNHVIKKLKELNVKSPGGKDIWNFRTLYLILDNDKYIGDATINKYYMESIFTKTPTRNVGQRDRYYVRNHHDAIISKEDFNKVQEIISNKRNETLKNNNINKSNNNLLSWKGVCGFCGCSLELKRTKKIYNSYRCRNSISSIYRSLCPNSERIKEEELISIYLKTFKKAKKILIYNLLDTKYYKRLNYIQKNIINEKFKQFDKKVFDKIIKLIIIGGYDKNNNLDPFIIRFIIKEDDIFENGRNNRKEYLGKTIKLVEYNFDVNFTHVNWDINRNYNKIDINKINASVELIDYGDFNGSN